MRARSPEVEKVFRRDVCRLERSIWPRSQALGDIRGSRATHKPSHCVDEGGVLMQAPVSQAYWRTGHSAVEKTPRARRR
eukprot:CAMPEP_0180561552 /NCGR_PEP_ID=MMETSP1037_2-20121125/3443_1 /TAXON_ID=632150 /ORGANISM="Azadinium spinosum, Strain 3D9" /LENGTH=78 /DNA_ID=CAMNT_0022578203 /DNA_START=122 /DNA_END=354 /DNA_ORIENTATION=-